MSFLNKIGKEVLFLKSNETNQRNGEGDFIRLKDGSIMHAYTSFIGTSWEDDARAQISAIYSYDEGETWQDNRVLIPLGENDKNLMSVSLLRMKNGDLGVFHARKYVAEDGDIYTEILFKRSTDEGKTWSKPVKCLDFDGYVVYENCRVCVTKTGRIIVPMNYHPYVMLRGKKTIGGGKSFFVASDDDGTSFYRLTDFYELPFDGPAGLQETGLIELESGRLFAWSRTMFGCQYESFSEDDGKTWTQPKPSWLFYSPLSPMMVKHLGQKYTVAVHNPYAEHDYGMTSRTPLVCNVTQGGGEKFWLDVGGTFYIEDDTNKYFSYPSIFAGDNYFLVAYYIAQKYPDKNIGFGDMKITKIYFNEFEHIFNKK